ncbi:virulence factor TspB C-terminal domain-related protein [Acinetobacter sp. FL]|uniref:virulence factor TspB C-terminal domain-related protein n=1 Tax=Acinetobacter sp. FL TaxID=3231720 RepID=UPI00345B8C26
MIHRLNIFLLSLLICFSQVYLMSKAFAATPKWVLEYIKVEKQVAEKKRLQALLVKQINESGSLLKTTAVVETVPTASKVGSSMMKRIAAYGKVPGVQMIGVALVTQLIEGIGWVMEDGVYVKYKEPDPSKCEETPELCGQYVWFRSSDDDLGTFSSQEGICSAVASKYGQTFISASQRSDGQYMCNTKKSNGEADWWHVDKKLNPNPSQEPQKPTKVTLTAAMLGAAMLGKGYKDPDPNFNNDSVNTGNWTGVPEAYTPDSSGVGNELYESLEAKADKAPPTPDNKPAPIGDSRYNNDLSTNDDANDRSWGDEGTKGDSTGSTTTNPETGEQTTNTEFHLPPFCSWAFTVCEWYEKWQKTDTKVNEHLDRTREHQEEEKGFWQAVKDWFDWSKDDSDLPDRDDSDLDTSVEFEEKKVSLNVSAQCPAPTYETVSLHGVTAQVKTSDYSYICNLDWLIKPFVLGFSMVSACFILFGFQRGGDD